MVKGANSPKSKKHVRRQAVLVVATSTSRFSLFKEQLFLSSSSIALCAAAVVVPLFLLNTSLDSIRLYLPTPRPIMSPFAITRVLLLVGVVVLASSVQAFAPQPPLSSTKTTRSSSQLHLGIPSFFLPKNEDENAEAENKPEKKIGLSGVLQLITSGAGAPFLGEFEGVDKETGKVRTGTVCLLTQYILGLLTCKERVRP